MKIKSPCHADILASIVPFKSWLGLSQRSMEEFVRGTCGKKFHLWPRRWWPKKVYLQIPKGIYHWLLHLSCRTKAPTTAYRSTTQAANLRQPKLSPYRALASMLDQKEQISLFYVGVDKTTENTLYEAVSGPDRARHGWSAGPKGLLRGGGAWA